MIIGHRMCPLKEWQVALFCISRRSLLKGAGPSPLTYRINIYKIEMMIEFDWDERKNTANRKKHGVWFEEARSVFDDVYGRLFLDSKHSDSDDRFILIGITASVNF